MSAAKSTTPLPGVPLKYVNLKSPCYTPNGNGSTGDYMRVPAYEVHLNGDFIYIRSSNVTDGEILEVPMSNVAGFSRLVVAKAPAAAAPAAKVA